MNQAYFHFCDELNYFLPRKQKNRRIEHRFDWQASIKDMIESLGVPHPEIELIVVNDQSVDFDYQVQSGDSIQVYAHAEPIVRADKITLRPPLNDAPRFVLDTHLGRLAAYLRMMGFDTLYRNDYEDDTLAAISSSQKRVLLTRDIGVLKRSIVQYGCYIRATNPRQQLVETILRYQLLDHATPFKHCMKCNGLLEPVAKETILDRLPPRSALYYDEFHCCRQCQQIYWKGSHFERMQQLITKVINTHS